MEQIFTPQFFAQFGATGVVAFFGYKAIVRLYMDMRADSKQREERLMSYLDGKSETDKKVAETLENIDKRLNKLEYCTPRSLDKDEVKSEG